MSAAMSAQANSQATPRPTRGPDTDMVAKQKKMP